MRLLKRDDSGELSLTEDLVGDNIPPYAILSHTWKTNPITSKPEEVTFEDVVNGTEKGKAGYDKIKFCAEQAGRDGLQYFWVDTCCINKSNSNELSEAINSMFRWYHKAARCYVYLSDVSINPTQNNDQPEVLWEPNFRTSRWFTRGWTLQELLAPVSVEFFSQEGARLGDKRSLERQVHEITGIPIPALQGTPLSQFGVDERLGWATTRQTTRKEDEAYCLLGLFDVFIPLIYGEGSGHAMRRLRKEIDDNLKRSEWLRKLYTCPYGDRKDRNPLRVEGTCEWFTSHSLFRNWQQSSEPSLLWVSADPGCGKSVLAKYLADKVLPSTDTRTTCYFFFKDDFEDQRSSTSALCCILRQIFLQHPTSLSNQILKKFEEDGDKLLTSFHDLWDILISTATDYTEGEIVCILDALDECGDLERNRLIDAISEFYSYATTRTPSLKFLLTSRPYLDIKRQFQYLEYKLPTIHLKGENEEEVGKISCEIDMVIKSRVAEISDKLELRQEEQIVLQEELTRVPNRTYLWVHLIFNEIENSILLSPGNIRSEVRNLPKTVDEAYDRILSKSRDITLARKLLHIVVAAARPLTLQEMALALAIRSNHRSLGDLELWPEERFRPEVRELCGLFVVVIDSRIYLLHQTAREFLIPPLSPRASASLSPGPRSTALQWKFSLYPGESNRILAEICIWRLSLSDFDFGSLPSEERDQQNANRTLLVYSAEHWADHFRDSDGGDNCVITTAVDYCCPNSPVSSAWFEIYQRVTLGEVPGSFTPLLVAAYFGLSEVVDRLPKEAFKNVNLKDSRHGRSALFWACSNGHEAVVQQLLVAGAKVNAKDNDGRTPLHDAAENGHESVIQRLLAVGNDSKAKKVLQRLLAAGNESKAKKVLQRLLAAGANVNAKDKDDWAPLHLAAWNGHGAVVQRLLAAGADANAENNINGTPLHLATSNGHDAIVQQLLAAGADANAKDSHVITPLHKAASNDYNTIVERLIVVGADINAKDEGGWTPLHNATSRGNSFIVQRLLIAGADINASDTDGQTPLHVAVSNGRDALVQRFLAAGADANMRDYDGRTALHKASLGAYNKTAWNFHDAIVQRLLVVGADINAKDKDSWTPLHLAAWNGHDVVVQRFLIVGADINAKNKKGETPLFIATLRGYNAIVQQLLAAGADTNATVNDG